MPAPVSSRELSGWLYDFASSLSADLSRLRQLQPGCFPMAEDVVGRISDVARWLDNAKFQVEDPFRYKLVCEYLTRSNRSDLTFFKAMAQAALKAESLLPFINDGDFQERSKC